MSHMAMSSKNKIRVIVVDDSAVIRGLIVRMLETEDSIEVVESVSNGEMAIKALKRSPAEVIVLDIEMPVMDGLEALPELLKVDPNVQIVMASTLTTRNADISLKAMNAGAADYIPKPSSTRDISSGDDFRREVIGKVTALGQAAKRAKGIPAAGNAAPQAGAGTEAGSAAAPSRPQPTNWAQYKQDDTAIHLRKPPILFKAKAIAIGSSTGGPQALFKMLEHLKGHRQPIFITQHMPPAFTEIMAAHITRQTGLNCSQPSDGDKVEAGHAYLAPGDYHMRVEEGADGVVIRLDQGPKENFCRPAVDPMMRSLISVYGKHILGVILTGMGHDGQAGCVQIADAGGMVVAQDEESSVVWGMPGAAAYAGACSEILPIDEIGPRVKAIAAAGGI